MDKWTNNFLKELREKRTTYKDMVEFCADSLVLNNYMINELSKKDIFFEPFCGDDMEYFNENYEEITREQYEKAQENGEEVSEQYIDIYQYYIIDGQAAQRFADYTNEIVIYNDDLDIYLLCVTHYGTAWEGVPASWKDPEQCDNEGGADDEE